MELIESFPSVTTSLYDLTHCCVRLTDFMKFRLSRAAAVVTTAAVAVRTKLGDIK